MARYIVLYRFTDQGLKNIKDTVKQADEHRKEQEARGFTVHGVYWTQGSYDLVAIIEAPSEEAMVAGLFNIAEAGNVRSETLRAFDAAEMQRIVQP
ncbi:MAG: GYD domain-containing protein [Isosphaeraceae bacterium]|nr:GYD domain-containing protein [Isosphaeraceae bacterium]